MSETARGHKSGAPEKLQFGIYVCSTSRYEQMKKCQKVDDPSGNLIESLLESAGHTILFRKIISVTLDLTQSEFEHLDAELSTYGYLRKEQHGLTVFTSPDIEIQAAVFPNPQYRIRTIRCSLAGRPDKPIKMDFGNKATLTLTPNATAIWTFGRCQTSFVHK